MGIKNVTEDGHLDFAAIRHIAEDDYARWTRRVEPRSGDIVFTYEATLNRYAIIPAGFRGCLGRRMALIRPNPARVDTQFLYYYFFTPRWREMVSQSTLSGATVDRLPLTKFPSFPVQIPSLSEQRRISGTLAAYDDLIENCERRIRVLDEMARALYREWFVLFRYPGYEKVSLVDSPLGPIPKNWPVSPASVVLKINPKVNVLRAGERPFVPMASLSGETMVISDVESRAFASGSKFQNGDALFARITPCLENGKTGFVQFLPDDASAACGSTEFIVLRGRSVPPEFVYCLARSAEFRGHAIKSMSGATGRQRVQEPCFEQFLLPHPPEHLLSRFAELTRSSFKLVQTLHQRAGNLRQTRDLLLPRLLSGKLSVNEVT